VDITRTDFPSIKDKIIMVLERDDKRNMENCEAQSNHIVSKTIHL